MKIKNKEIATLTFIAFIFTILLTTSAIGGTSKIRRGSTFTSNKVEVTNIESKLLDNEYSGHGYYSIKAKVRNRTDKTIKVSIFFQAIDRDGYELEEVYFYDKSIRARGTANLTDRNSISIDDYENIWTWKIEKLKVE